MKKGRAIILLSFVSVILAVLAVFTFIRFSVGVKNYNSILGAVDLDYDMAGGMSYTFTLANDNDVEVENIDEVLNKFKTRINALGYSEYSLTALRPVKSDVKVEDLDYSIRLDVKDTASIASDISVISAYGTVKFFGGESANPTTEILADVNAVENAEYAGTTVTTESATVHQVSVKFTSEAYDYLKKAMKEASDESASYYLSITLGETTLLSGDSAISESYFSDRTIMITSGTESSARQLALQLKTGGLEYKYNVSDGVKISSLLGTNAATFSAIAIGALIIVCSAMFIVKFKGFGLAATLSLITFILVETAMLVAVPGIVLSAAGVIGIALASLIVVDGLVMTAKRIEEEGANGKTYKASVKTGYKRALFPVMTVNVISLIVALSLFAFTSAGLKVFAITLAIGSVISFICSVLISRMFVEAILPLTKNPEKFLGIKREG